MVDLNNEVPNTSFRPVDPTEFKVEKKVKEQTSESPDIFDQFAGQFDPTSVKKSTGKDGDVQLSIELEEIGETLVYSSEESKDAENLSQAFNHDIAAVVLHNLFEEKGNELSLTSHSWADNSLTVVHHKSGLGLMVPLRDDEGKCVYIEKGTLLLNELFGDLKKASEKKGPVAIAIDGFAVPFTLRAEYPETVSLPIWSDPTLYIMKSSDKFTMDAMLASVRQKCVMKDSEETPDR